jgi:DNA-binding response OmpR family regulator
MKKHGPTQSILIIEDDATLQQTLVYKLEQEGYKATAAFDGLAGLELARDQTPDLIVLDIMLP